MDPVTALGFASNIISFVDFAGKLISKGHEIYKSASGASRENVEIETVIDDLSLHVDRLKQGNTITAVTPRGQQLQSLASDCAILADEILQKLNKLKVDKNIKYRGLRSIGKTLRAAWGTKDLEKRVATLEGFRNQLQFGILIALKYVVFVFFGHYGRRPVVIALLSYSFLQLAPTL